MNRHFNCSMKDIILRNSQSEIHFSIYGASIMKWVITHSKLGEIDVVLGLEKQEEYGKEHPFFGSIIGRYANRISNGIFTLDGKIYELEKNIGHHHIHGGTDNFAFKKWDLVTQSERFCTFRYFSHHLEGEYPGNLFVEVTYSLTEDNTLEIEYSAQADRNTILNLTNHSYFNLNGHQDDTILDHQFQIFASQYTPTDPDNIPTGLIETVKSSPFDFKEPKDLTTLKFNYPALNLSKVFDHNYVLDTRPDKLAAIVRSRKSGLVLKCKTDQPGLQFYTGNYLNEVQGKNQVKYKNYQGFCLEAQAFPDSINHEHFTDVILRKEEFYSQHTSYQILYS